MPVMKKVDALTHWNSVRNRIVGILPYSLIDAEDILLSFCGDKPTNDLPSKVAEMFTAGLDHIDIWLTYERFLIRLKAIGHTDDEAVSELSSRKPEAIRKFDNPNNPPTPEERMIFKNAVRNFESLLQDMEQQDKEFSRVNDDQDELTGDVQRSRLVLEVPTKSQLPTMATGAPRAEPKGDLKLRTAISHELLFWLNRLSNLPEGQGLELDLPDDKQVRWLFSRRFQDWFNTDLVTSRRWRGFLRRVAALRCPYVPWDLQDEFLHLRYQLLYRNFKHRAKDIDPAMQLMIESWNRREVFEGLFGINLHDFRPVLRHVQDLTAEPVTIAPPRMPRRSKANF